VRSISDVGRPSPTLIDNPQRGSPIQDGAPEAAPAVVAQYLPETAARVGTRRPAAD
jgi:hypothetical protein